MNLLETVAPSWALKRKHAKAALKISASSGDGGYSGASRTRKIFSKWNPSKADAASDLDKGKPALRERSRDLEKNDPIAHSILHTKRQYVIGAGLKPEPAVNHQVLGISAEEAEKINDQLLHVFNLFANNKKCDWTERKDFYQKQAELYHTKNLNGDGLALLPYLKEKGFLFGTRIHSIEIDRLSNPKGEKERPGFRVGIELDSRGRIKKIHVSKAHPGSGVKLKKGDWQAVTAKRKNGWPNFLLIANKNHRSEQITGVPDLTPVVAMLKQLGSYMDAELLAAQVASKFTVFIKSNAPDALSNLGPGQGQLQQPQSAAPEPDEDEPDLELGDGLVVQLGLNEDAVIADPNRPNPNLGPFVDKLTTYIASATGLPFELVVKHFNASYSASKAALLMFLNFLMVERAEFVREFCRPIYEMVIDEAVATGMINLPGYMADPVVRSAYLQCAWHGAPIGDLDETKAANAAVIRMNNNLTTKTQESRKLGNDWDQVSTRRAVEVQREKSTGITPAQYEQTEEPPTNQIDKDGD